MLYLGERRSRNGLPALYNVRRSSSHPTSLKRVHAVRAELKPQHVTRFASTRSNAGPVRVAR